LLTGRWPSGSTDQPSAGVPDAPRTPAGVYAPRQLRAGIPRAVDVVVLRTVDPRRQPSLAPIATPMALVRALDDVDVRSVETGPASRRRRPPAWLVRSLPKLAALAVVIGVGIIGYQAGQQVGELPRRRGALDALVAPTPSPGSGSATGARVDLRRAPVTVRDYDPYSRDGVEHRDAVPNVYDADPSTVWSTDGYRTAAFSGLKPGVGLLVDLGAPTALRSVQVGMTTGGADIDLRATNTLGQNADDFTVVARSKDAKQVATLSPAPPTTSRYWLVWFTKLPKADDGKYRGAVAELVLTRRS
jgi:hypothetical protein